VHFTKTLKMKFASALFSTVLIVCVFSAPVKRDVNPSLVPDLGLQAGLNPTGTGDCDGAVLDKTTGQPIKVPCSCPPDRQTFLASLNANVNAGHAVHNPSIAVTFPTDPSTASALARNTAMTITLQNLNGPGVGCPVVSTTLQAQAAALQGQ